LVLCVSKVAAHCKPYSIASSSPTLANPNTIPIQNDHESSYKRGYRNVINKGVELNAKGEADVEVGAGALAQAGEGGCCCCCALPLRAQTPAPAPPLFQWSTNNQPQIQQIIKPIKHRSS
jgi:hypothetical protein